MTHFPSQPWELDVGEWEHASGTALVLICSRSTIEMSTAGVSDESVQTGHSSVVQYTALSESPDTPNSETWRRPRAARAVQDTWVKHKAQPQLAAVRMTLRIRWR